jgi:hypothetical protein
VGSFGHDQGLGSEKQTFLLFSEGSILIFKIDMTKMTVQNSLLQNVMIGGDIGMDH